MTVSTTTDYTDTRATIIRDALLEIREISPVDQVADEIGEIVNRHLNRLIKSWQAFGDNLWKKNTGYLFLDVGVSDYLISENSSQHFTSEPYKYTSLSADASSGVSIIAVESTANINSGDNIGIVLNNNTRFWAKVDSTGIGTVDISPSTLPDDARSGNKVVFYTNKTKKPFNILSVNRLTVSQSFRNEVPLTYLSYQDFFELPNKNSAAVPTMYNYDRQLNDAVIRIWPVPSDFTYDLSFVFQSVFFDFDTNENSPDFPQEWYDALVLNLAVRCASTFGKNVGQSYANLEKRASDALILANSHDNEQGSMRIQPENRRLR